MNERATKAWMDLHEDADIITVSFQAMSEGIPNEGELTTLKVSAGGRTFQKPMRVAKVRHLGGYQYEAVLASSQDSAPASEPDEGPRLRHSAIKPQPWEHNQESRPDA